MRKSLGDKKKKKTVKRKLSFKVMIRFSPAEIDDRKYELRILRETRQNVSLHLIACHVWD